MIKKKLTSIILSSLILISLPITTFAQETCSTGTIEADGTCNTETISTETIVEGDRTTEEAETHDLISGTDLKNKTLEEIADIYEISITEYATVLSEHYGTTISPTASFKLLHDNYGVEPSVAKDIASSIKTGIALEVEEETSESNEKPYHMGFIFLGLTLLYIFTRILKKTKKMSMKNYRKFWNILLLFTFVGSGLLGLLLIIKVNFGTIIPLPFNILFWHVELGTAMFLISVFHIAERWYFFKNILK